MATYSTLHAEQETLWCLGCLRIIQAIGERSGQAVILTEHVLPAGTHIYAHHHQDEDEGVYVTIGEATYVCGEKVICATAGTLLFLPQHVHHHLEVGKSDPFHYLSWTTAKGFAHDVLHMGEPGQALALTPPPSTPQERIRQVATLLRDATIPSPEHFRALLELWTLSASDC